jgi:hypothetical protein
MGRELTSDERSVRGVVVKGLTGSDLRHLDVFEGVASTMVSCHPRLFVDIATRNTILSMFLFTVLPLTSALFRNPHKNCFQRR